MGKSIAIFSTRDTKLATLLSTLGWQFENPSAPATRIKRESGEESTVFHFLAAHPETSQPAEEIMGWVTGGFPDPEHPAAYIYAALKNRDELLTVVKRTPRQVVFKRNGKLISISEHATEADKKRFAKFI